MPRGDKCAMAISIAAYTDKILLVLLTSLKPEMTKGPLDIQQLALGVYLWAQESWIKTPSFKNKDSGFKIYISDP